MPLIKVSLRPQKFCLPTESISRILKRMQLFCLQLEASCFKLSFFACGSVFYAEQLDAEGLGRKPLLTASGDPLEKP